MRMWSRRTGTHVRKLLGWDRYDSPTAVTAINDLYRQELRLWLNLYLPSVKLVKKVRVGSKVRRVYDAAQTPLQRVLASGQADAERVAELKKLCLSMDPFRLGQQIDEKLQRIYQMANLRLSPQPDPANGEARTRANPQPRHRQNGKRKSNEKTYNRGLRSPRLGEEGLKRRPPSPRPPCSGSWLHFECLYNLAYGYILTWLDAH